MSVICPAVNAADAEPENVPDILPGVSRVSSEMVGPLAPAAASCSLTVVAPATRSA